MEPITFDVTGPPLSEITPGVWDLALRDGSRVLAVVDRGDDGKPWWALLGERCEAVDCSTDWTNVVGAIGVGIEEMARRRPALVAPSDLERLRSIPAPGPVSISGRGRSSAPPGLPACHPRHASYLCQSCDAPCCMTCDAPVDADPGEIVIKTIGNRFCNGCIEAEARVNGLSIERTTDRRESARSERIAEYNELYRVARA